MGNALAESDNYKEIKQLIDSARAKLKYSELKILVIGSTGAGKTSLVNLLYFLSRDITPKMIREQKTALVKTKYFDGRTIGENDAMKTGESQTLQSQEYSCDIKLHELTIKLVMLDTPGLGDTRGEKYDECNIENIVSTVANTVDLNAIMLLLNGAEARVSERMVKITDKLNSLIPDIMQENLFVLLTNTAVEPNLDISMLGIKIEKNHLFMYDNLVFSTCPTAEGKIYKKIINSYLESGEVIARLLYEIAQCCVKPTEQFRKLKEERDKLKKAVVCCVEEEKIMHKRRGTIVTEIQRLKETKLNTKILFESLQKEKQEHRWKCIETSYHNTVCLSCKLPCHEDCGLNEIKIRGCELYKNCWAFSGNNICNRCNHEYTSHYHAKEKYIEEIITVKTLEDADAKKINAMEDVETAKQEFINKLEKEKEKHEEEIKRHRKEVMQHAWKLKEICSKFDYIREVTASVTILEEQIAANDKKIASLIDKKDAESQNFLEDSHKENEASNEALKGLKKLQQDLISQAISISK
jgi:energy-coupling factor transporter ATP-binding protein EcfA2